MVSIFVAAYSADFASNILGRLLVLYIGCIPCVVGVVVQSFAESAMTIFGGKLVSTLGFGLGHVLAPVFIAKIAPKELRGACLTLINNMIVLPVPVLPESPSWLLLKGRREESGRSLEKFHGADLDVGTNTCRPGGRRRTRAFRFPRRGISSHGRLIVQGIAAMTVLLFVIGCFAIPTNNQQALSAMVALMAFWGFLAPRLSPLETRHRQPACTRRHIPSTSCRARRLEP
ncbi:maltose permease [Verticillium alfalfae VaMs.102]|uniref:Maltose permease n=1 Tax=Verticillium alfalfae (strain VaMs.102 / ATCC MYA-4576 / FGSC 10136) TaxID=526221 RepID=C9SEK6_VERA1|nr:maltose permease [Verticillium alfalfae VaMs.102]EEY16599.1 maltose permease [Verticillium alfalfae VaMs.102]